MAEPWIEFFSRPHGALKAAGVLLFLTFFRVGDFMANTMNMQHRRCSGFTNTEIGVVGKVIAFFGSVLGGLVGGGLVLYLGLFRGLIIFGIAQSVTNVAYVALALVGKSMPVLIGGMVVDQDDQQYRPRPPACADDTLKIAGRRVAPEKSKPR